MCSTHAIIKDVLYIMCFTTSAKGYISEDSTSLVFHTDPLVDRFLFSLAEQKTLVPPFNAWFESEKYRPHESSQRKRKKKLHFLQTITMEMMTMIVSIVRTVALTMLVHQMSTNHG